MTIVVCPAYKLLLSVMGQEGAKDMPSGIVRPDGIDLARAEKLSITRISIPNDIFIAGGSFHQRTFECVEKQEQLRADLSSNVRGSDSTLKRFPPPFPSICASRNSAAVEN